MCSTSSRQRRSPSRDGTAAFPHPPGQPGFKAHPPPLEPHKHSGQGQLGPPSTKTKEVSVPRSAPLQHVVLDHSFLRARTSPRLPDTEDPQLQCCFFRCFSLFCTWPLGWPRSPPSPWPPLTSICKLNPRPHLQTYVWRLYLAAPGAPQTQVIQT